MSTSVNNSNQLVSDSSMKLRDSLAVLNDRENLVVTRHSQDRFFASFHVMANAVGTIVCNESNCAQLDNAHLSDVERNVVAYFSDIVRDVFSLRTRATENWCIEFMKLPSSWTFSTVEFLEIALLIAQPNFSIKINGGYFSKDFNFDSYFSLFSVARALAKEDKEKFLSLVRYFNTESNVQVVFSVTELIAEQILNTELYKSAEQDLISERYSNSRFYNSPDELTMRILANKIVSNVFMENSAVFHNEILPSLKLFADVHFKHIADFAAVLSTIPASLDFEFVRVTKLEFVHFLRKHEDAINACTNVSNV